MYKRLLNMRDSYVQYICKHSHMDTVDIGMDTHKDMYTHQAHTGIFHISAPRPLCAEL
jgi:hypothetical protein